MSNLFLTIPGVRPFFISQFLALFSGLFGLSTISWFIVSQFGAAGIAQFYMVQALISFFSYVLFSPVGDRYDKITVMHVFSLAIAVRAVLLALLASSDGLSLWSILLLQAINAISMSAVVPARSALLPDMVEPSDLEHAIGIQKSIENMGRIAGPACAGLALVKLSVAWCLWIHAVFLLIVCALNLYVIRRRGKKERAASNENSWAKDIMDSWRLRLSIPIEKYSAILGVISLLAFLPALTLLIPMKIKESGWGTPVLGLTEGLLSAGALIAGLGISAKLSELFGKFRLFLIASLSQGFLFALAAITTAPAIFAVAYFLIGFCGTVSALVMGTQRMLATPRNYRARLNASGMTITMIAGSTGSWMSGVALQHFSITEVHLGAALIVLTTAVSYLFIPRLKEFLELSADNATLWYAREYVNAFTDRPN